MQICSVPDKIGFYSSKKHIVNLQVALWRDQYGIDGIDLDLEEGAGSNQVISHEILFLEFRYLLV